MKTKVKKKKQKVLTPFAKAFFDCKTMYEIAEQEANYFGEDAPDPSEFVDNYFADKFFLLNRTCTEVQNG